jgi:hypothetical protein
MDKATRQCFQMALSFPGEEKERKKERKKEYVKMHLVFKKGARALLTKGGGELKKGGGEL